MIDYLINSPFYSPFIQQKGIHVLVMLEYNKRQKPNKTKPHPALIPHGVLYAGQTPTPDLYLKGVPRRGEQSPIEDDSYKGYSPSKCTCKGRTTNTHPSKMSPSHMRMPSVKTVIDITNDPCIEPSPAHQYLMQVLMSNQSRVLSHNPKSMW